MINTNIEISDLIETIAKFNSGLDTFYFELKDTLEITSHFTQSSEDAIAFLFDADIHLWKLVYWDINRDWHGSKQWTIKLQR